MDNQKKFSKNFNVHCFEYCENCTKKLVCPHTKETLENLTWQEVIKIFKAQKEQQNGKF